MQQSTPWQIADRRYVLLGPDILWTWLEIFPGLTTGQVVQSGPRHNPYASSHDLPQSGPRREGRRRLDCWHTWYKCLTNSVKIYMSETLRSLIYSQLHLYGQRSQERCIIRITQKHFNIVAFINFRNPYERCKQLISCRSMKEPSLEEQRFKPGKSVQL